MRWLRWLGLLGVGLAAALAAALLALESIDWSGYLSPLADQLRASTGRELTVTGPLHVRVGWHPTVSVEGVKLKNTKWGSRPEMLEVERFELQLALVPLVFRRVDIHRVVLRGASLLLEIDKQGRANWHFKPERLAEDGAPPASEGPAATERADAETAGESKSEQAAPTIAAALALLSLEDAEILYRDARSKSEQRLEIRSFQVRPKLVGDDTALEGRMVLRGEPIAIDATLSGVEAALAGGPLGIEAALEAGGARATLRGDLAKPASLAGARVAIALDGKQLATLSKLFESELPEVGPYRARAVLSDVADGFSLADLELQVGETRLAGDARILLGGARPEIQGRLQSSLVRLRDLAGPAAIDAGSEADALEAELAADQALAESPTAEASAADGKSTAPLKKGSARRARRLIPNSPFEVSGLRALDANLALAIDRIEVDGMVLEALQTTAALEAGRLSLSPLSLSVLGAGVSGRAAVDASPEAPVLAVDLALHSADAGKLLRDLGSGDFLSGGELDLRLALTGSGRSLHQIAAAGNGTIDLRLGSAQIRSESLDLLYSDAVRAILDVKRKQKSDLNCVRGVVQIAKGVGTVEEFALDTPAVGALASGELMFGPERLDISITPLIKHLKDVNALPDARIRGTWLAPELAVDRGATLTAGTSALLRVALNAPGLRKSDGKTKKGVQGCEQLIARAARSRTRAAQTAAAPSQGAESDPPLEGKRAGRKLAKQREASGEPAVEPGGVAVPEAATPPSAGQDAAAAPP